MKLGGKVGIIITIG